MDWHLGQLDALRGIAFMAVLLVHSVFWDMEHVVRLPYWPNVMAFSGQQGVQLFFLVSAFTLFMSNDNRNQEQRPVRNFFIRRFFRIAPMFYLAVLLTALDAPAALNGPVNTGLSLVFLAGFWPGTVMGGAAAGWSVATEAAFYFTLPFLFRIIRSPRQALLALFLAGQVVFWLVPHLGWFVPQRWYFFSLLGNMPVFLAGIAVYFLWRQFVYPHGGHTNEKKTLSIAALVLFCLLYFAALPFNDAHVVSESLVLCLLLVAVLLHPWRLLVNRYTIALGKISFSMYLIHPHTGVVAQKLLLYGFDHYRWMHHMPVLFVGKFVLTFAMTLPLAWLTFTCVEKPGIQLGRRLIRHLENRDTVSAALPRVWSRKDTADAQF